MKNRLIRSKHGHLGLYILFMVTGIVVVTLCAVLAPMALSINSQLYAAGDRLREDHHDQTRVVNASMQEKIDSVVWGGPDNLMLDGTQMIAGLYEYGWVLLLLIGLLVVYLSARSLVAYGGGGYV